jgi:hypothetical protein
LEVVGQHSDIKDAGKKKPGHLQSQKLSGAFYLLSAGT